MKVLDMGVAAEKGDALHGLVNGATIRMASL